MSVTLASPGQNARALTPKYAVSTFGISVLGLLTANLVPVMILALEALGIEVSTAGLFTTVSLLSTAAACILSSRYCTSAYRKPVARIGSLVGGSGFLLAALAPSDLLVFLGMVGGGIGIGATSAASGAALAALKDPERMSGLSSLSNRVLVTIVLAVIPLLGIQMLTVFGFLSLLSFSGALFAYWLPTAPADPATTDPGTAAAAPPAAKPSQQPAPAGRARPTGTVVGLVLLVSFALWGLSEDSFWSILGVLGTSQPGLDNAQLSLVLSGSTAGGILASFFILLVGDKLGRSIPLLVFIVAGSILKFSATQLTDSGSFIVAVIIWNTLYALVFAYVNAVAIALDRSGRWSGPLAGVYLVGSALAPFAATLLSEQFGYTVFGYASSGLSLLLVIPLALAARRSSRKPTATRKEQP
ncbi:MAG: MFS transporter [Renibacterium salmoninarum]|nr:MFS transporter [Renibacterium salmoninarum]